MQVYLYIIYRICKKIFPEQLKKLKVHLILHLVDNMKEFGPTASFNTERYVQKWLQFAIDTTKVRFINLLLYFRCETFNSFIRARNIFANKLAPSRDIAMSFNTLQHLEFIFSGGYLGTFGTEEHAMYYIIL